jgi:hypothetical protein
MNEERFQHDLTAVMRAIAGEEAPAALRYRLADVTDRPQLKRRAWFGAPVQLATVTAALVVVALVALLLVPSGILGPAATGSPTPSVSPSPTSSASPSATTSPTPSPSASPAQTPAPSLATWTRLHWSSTVQPALPPEGTLITDIVPWRGAYVATGAIEQAGSPDSPPEWSQAFFSSPDGTHWTTVQQVTGLTIDDPMAATAAGGELHALVTYGGGLLAITERVGHDGAPLLWRSEDGTTWTRIDSASWSAAWANARVIAVAGGPRGVVAVGADQHDAPVIVQGADGSSWQQPSLGSIFDHANFRDIVAYGGGFAIVGRDGEPDPASGMGPLGVGKPAAWISPDGLAWSAAQVEGTAVVGGQLMRVAAGANGLFAVGIAVSNGNLPAIVVPTVGWASADGLTWRIARVDVDQPDGFLLASDGTRMVILREWAFDAPQPDGRMVNEPVAWASTDGLNWTRVGYQGHAYWYPPDATPDIGGIGQIWVVPDGVIAGSSGPVRQSFSFATATGP